MEYNPPKKKKMRKIMIQNNISNSLNINYIRKNNSNINSTNKEIITKVKEIMAYNDQELNNMEYKLALKYDNRTFSEFFVH